MSSDKKLRSFSIIMTVYDQAHELKENLPAFLTQEYEPGYEVIVIDETSTDDTADILKLMKNQFSNLYTTFLPKPNRLIVRRKLAINIGLKAAKNDWVVITKIHTPPTSTDLLMVISENLGEGTEICLGYIGKKGIRIQPFYDLDDARYHICKAERKLNHVCKRRHLNYMLGRYDFIIVRKSQAYDILKFFEEKMSWKEIQGARIRILLKNLFGRSETTLLVSE